MEPTITQDQLLTMSDAELTRRMGELGDDLAATPATDPAPQPAAAETATATPGTTADTPAPLPGETAAAPAGPASPAVPATQPTATPGSPTPGDTPAPPDPDTALIPPQYKTFAEFRRGHDELTTLLNRQAQELGAARRRLKEVDVSRLPAAPVPTTTTTTTREAPTAAPPEITDEQIKAAIYEEMDPDKGFRLWTQREQQRSATAQEAQRALSDEQAASQRYQDDVQQAYEGLCKDIPGFEAADGQLRNAILSFGRTNGLLAADEEGFQRELQRLDADPVNGPRVVRMIYAQMQKAQELERLKTEHDRRLKDLESRGRGIADDVANNLHRAARAPVVMGAGAGAGGGSEAGLPAL
ncbi:MAG: hypothetical protein ABIO65_07005, partial [Nitrospiria bacterium]